MTLPRFFLIVVALFSSGFFSMWAADSKLRVELAWGTDGVRPESKEGKEMAELDTKAREKLRHLRWKNYWVVKAKTLVVDSKESQRVTLDRCLVDLKAAAGGQIEVRLNSAVGGKEPKLIKTVLHSMEALKRGEFLILAGDDKEKWDDAWFVIIRSEP